MNRVEKTLDVTMIVSKGGKRVEMYEPESGDYFGFDIGAEDDQNEIAEKIGMEVLGWMSMMEEQLDDDEDDMEVEK